MSYRDTCPKREVVTVHHTIATWLPVTLSCGHREEINYTAHVGHVMGCIACAKEGVTPDEVYDIGG